MDKNQNTTTQTDFLSKQREHKWHLIHMEQRGGRIVPLNSYMKHVEKAIFYHVFYVVLNHHVLLFCAELAAILMLVTFNTRHL